MKRLDLILFEAPAVQVACDTLVVPLPSDERPLRGEAGWVDWRVCGAISRQLAVGFVGGTRGEATLLPAPPPLAAARILIVGMGKVSQLEGRALHRVFCVIGEKLIDLRSDLALLALPGAVDLATEADLLVRGCLQALSSSRSPAAIRLGIASGASRVEALGAAVSGADADARRRQVGLEIGWAQAGESGADALRT